MALVIINFHDDLNYFISIERRHTEFSHTFDGRVSIKDMIESLGVPHTELQAITVNGRPVDLSYLVEDGARIEVWGFSSQVPAEWQVVRPPLVGELRFVLDVHLGQLATYLRMLGFDTL